MKNYFKTDILSQVALMVFLTVSFAALCSVAPERYYYQIKVYHFKTSQQAAIIHHYLQYAYLPAMYRLGVKNIGVFNPVTLDTADRKIYVLAPFSNWGELEQSDKKLVTDGQYLADGKEYLDAAYNNLPYTRIETIVLRAFPGMPAPAAPHLTANKTERIYELRSYENPTEKYHISKLKMFNEGGEITLFKKLNFNAVFYAEVLAGARTPNLMYMTTFNNMQERDEHWKRFQAAPEWVALKAMPEYLNNVSKIDDIFLHPASYSDF